jgi:hypothetical protein
MVGLKTPIDAQSNVSFLTKATDIPSFVMQTADHLVGLDYIFVGGNL